MISTLLASATAASQKKTECPPSRPAVVPATFVTATNSSTGKSLDSVDEDTEWPLCDWRPVDETPDRSCLDEAAVGYDYVSSPKAMMMFVE